MTLLTKTCFTRLRGEWTRCGCNQEQQAGLRCSPPSLAPTLRSRGLAFLGDHTRRVKRPVDNRALALPRSAHRHHHRGTPARPPCLALIRRLNTALSFPETRASNAEERLVSLPLQGTGVNPIRKSLVTLKPRRRYFFRTAVSFYLELRTQALFTSP